MNIKNLYLLLFCIVNAILASAQDPLSYLLQVTDVKEYQGLNFKLEGQFYIEKISSNAGSALMALNIKNGRGAKSFLNKDAMISFKANKWNKFSLTGKLDNKIDTLAVGVLFSGKARFYYDDIKLFVKTKKGEIEIPLKNNGFEQDSITAWNISGSPAKAIITSEKYYSGKQSLLIDNSQLETQSFGNNSKAGKYITVNGIRLYYEMYGDGEPLLLLHGNNESINSFEKQIGDFSKKYKVIAVDSRGQGNSTADNTKLTYELFANDINSFLDSLHLQNVNILGWSDGANIGLTLAMQHPDKVKKLAIMSANLYNNSSSVDEKISVIIQKQIKEMEAAQTSKNDIGYRLKILLLTEPNINPDSLQIIKAPVLVMAGEKDVIKEQHTKLISQKIPDSKLVIFKNTSHEAPKEIPEQFNKTVLNFFSN